LPPPKHSEMGAFYLVFGPMELSAGLGDTTIPGNGVGIAGHLRSPRLRPPIAEAVHAFEDKAPGFVAHHGPLHPSLPTALRRRFGEEHDGPDDLVIMLDGIDKLPPNVLELFLS
jgi:hypothetical protein